MLSYGAQQLASGFRTVRKNTIQVAQDIPEDKYDHRPAEGARTVGQMLIHVAIVPMRLWHGMHGTRSTDVTGFDFFGLGSQMEAEEARPRTKAEIVDLLTSEGEAFASFLEGFSDAELNAMVRTYAGGGPVEKCRLEMLLGAKEHEMHHRAQLMLIERQLGIVPHITRQMNARIEQIAKAREATV
jgi:uncharacterized damage-inducible protein DinB